jgi:molybdopterin converting factor small subunit
MIEQAKTVEVKKETNATITSLYALYGKKCVEVDAAKNIIMMLQQQVDEFKKEIEVLKNDDTGSD